MDEHDFVIGAEDVKKLNHVVTMLRERGIDSVAVVVEEVLNNLVEKSDDQSILCALLCVRYVAQDDRR